MEGPASRLFGFVGVSSSVELGGLGRERGGREAGTGASGGRGT